MKVNKYNIFIEAKKELSIEEICKKYNIINYNINYDGSIDVNGDVDLTGLGLSKLPLKFKNVSGDFYCSDNELTSLIGSPKEVGGSFCCDVNNLVSLEGAPEKVGDDFYCHHNSLKSLIGSPKEIGGDFVCNTNNLISLEGAPIKIKDFYCYDNPDLISLKGCPEKVNKFYLKGTGLKDFEYFPENVEEIEISDGPAYNVISLFPEERYIEAIHLINEFDVIRKETNEIIIPRLIEVFSLLNLSLIKGYKNIYF
jgi:hypothetical protein